MSIDDIGVPSAIGIDVWRSVLHDVIDEVLDQILATAPAQEWEEIDDEWFDEPPGDPPEVTGIPDLSASLCDALGAAIERGVAVWGCDGTLRCTREFTERVLDRAGPVLDDYRRRGVTCDCGVLRAVVGRVGLPPRCPGRTNGDGDGDPPAPPGDRPWPWS